MYKYYNTSTNIEDDDKTKEKRKKEYYKRLIAHEVGHLIVMKNFGFKINKIVTDMDTVNGYVNYNTNQFEYENDYLYKNVK